MEKGLWNRFMPGVTSFYLTIGVIIGFLAGMVVGGVATYLALTVST